MCRKTLLISVRRQGPKHRDTICSKRTSVRRLVSRIGWAVKTAGDFWQKLFPIRSRPTGIRVRGRMPDEGVPRSPWATGLRIYREEPLRFCISVVVRLCPLLRGEFPGGQLPVEFGGLPQNGDFTENPATGTRRQMASCGWKKVGPELRRRKRVLEHCYKGRQRDLNGEK